jgi:hypothetical protein
MEKNEFNEKEVVSVLCESSRKFNLFYRKERLKYYNIPINWILKTDLGKCVNAKFKPEELRDGKIIYKIYFKKFPDADDAFLIAHEIKHALRFIENKPIIFEPPKNKESDDLATAFLTMLEDPIVDSFLNKKYEFDLLTEYKKGLKQAKEADDGLNKEPVMKSERLTMTLNLSKLILCWNLIKDQDKYNEWVEYKIICKTKWPIIWKMNEDALSIIQKTSQAKGLKEREKHALIFKRFDKHFGINKNNHQDAISSSPTPSLLLHN